MTWEMAPTGPADEKALLELREFRRKRLRLLREELNDLEARAGKVRLKIHNYQQECPHEHVDVNESLYWTGLSKVVRTTCADCGKALKEERSYR